MRQSSELTDLFAALAIAQGDISGATKDSLNPHFDRKYADLASVIDAIRKPFAANGLGYIQLVTVREKTVSVETILTHKTGQFIAENLDLPLLQNTPQGIGSAVTYGRRYALMAMTGVAPDDDDGNEASRSPAAAGRRTQTIRDDLSGDAAPADDVLDSKTYYLAQAGRDWAKIDTRAGMTKWWEDHKDGMGAIFDGKDDPLYVQLKAKFSERGKALPEPTTAPTEGPAT